MLLEPVIGLEIHVQLKTKTKMFCGCSNRGEFEPPNTTVCPICMGHPGALPAINSQALDFGVLIGLALDGKIATKSNFDRKNYFYPDLPKGYQISQKDLPVAEHGSLTFEFDDGQRGKRAVTVRINRVHLEEDAAKMLHGADGVSSFVDFNRGGTPLAEIVSEPDLHSPAEAKAFLQELRLVMRYLGVSDADMEKGHLRCDANISLRRIPEHPEQENWALQLNPKTEVKNLNSFRAVERALEYEIKRQTGLWETGQPINIQSTRGWNEATGETVLQRIKEDSHDYRYFPEPDLPPLELSELTAKLRSQVPELPAARRLRLAEEYGFSEADIRVMCDDKETADYAERVMSELREWIASSPAADGSRLDWDKHKPEFARLVSGWLLSKLGGIMAAHKIDIRILKITPENFAELLTMIHLKKVTGQNALLLLEEMALSGADPSIIAEEKNLLQLEDLSGLNLIAENIVVGNPKAVADWKSGKTNALQFLVGQMMKTTKGKAPPDLARKLVEDELKKL
ncbi:MAG: Asp-tRNA(Asn)/Glu-tRNA(Gln) amidotransferase subunit GatB [Patescibacteria group bacterium]|jgi:aspartyl-tRNA(Asn)/glutamyl-tRNA(Gln) amidotransferase subunit B